MDTKIFETVDGKELIVRSRKSAVFFELTADDNKKTVYRFNFKLKDLGQFKNDLNEIAKGSWGTLIPTEANSMGSDYYEYYDRDFDNNGYLSIKGKTLLLERPSLDSPRLYKFNKKKMESFLLDLEKEVVKPLGGLQ